MAPVKIPKISPSAVCSDGSKSGISPHLENQGTEKRKTVKPRMDTLDIQLIRPESTDFNRTQQITFYGNTGNKAWRFMPFPLITTLIPCEKNEDFASTDVSVSAADKAREWNGMTPFEFEYEPQSDVEVAAEKEKVIKSNRRVYFYNPVTGGAANLIAEIEILLDGQLVQVDRTGYFSIYNTMNRVFVNSDVRTRINGHPYILHNSHDQKKMGKMSPLKWYYKSENYEYALRRLNALDSKNPKAVILASDLDGVFPLTRPKNLGLEAISKCPSGYNQYPLVPPNTEITIRMRLCDPLHLRLGDSGCPNSKFFGSGDAAQMDPDDKFPFDKLNFQIQDMALCVQKIGPDDPKVQAILRNGSFECTFEQYIHRARALGNGRVNTSTQEKIPAGTRLVYVTFVRQNQLWKDGHAERSSDASRFCLPPGLTSVNFILNNTPILFEGNSLNFSRTSAHNSASARSFYSYLQKLNLTSDSFESFFPPTGYGFKHVFPLDLTPYVIDKPADLNVICSFGTESPSNYYVLMIIPQEVSISRPSPSSVWSTTANVA